MKNLILVFLLFLSTSAFAQMDTTKFKPVYNQGKVIWFTNVVDMFGVDSGKIQIPLQLNVGDTQKVAITNNLTTIGVTSLPYLTKSYSASDSIAGDWIDTASAVLQGYLEEATVDITLANFYIGGEMRSFAHYHFDIVCDDTLEISFNIGFIQGTKMLIPPGSYSSDRIRLYTQSSFPDFYIRRYGTGTVNYTIKVEGD